MNVSATTNVAYVTVSNAEVTHKIGVDVFDNARADSRVCLLGKQKERLEKT
jgi:hypothetical protein